MIKNIQQKKEKNNIPQNDGIYFIRNFATISIVLLLLIAGIVILFDPFFHYHAPFFHLDPVQTKHEYQINGVIQHLEYDSLVLGSSTAMNINNTLLDNFYQCKSIKAVGGNASLSLLCQYMEKAYQYQNLKYVFYSFDVFSLFRELDIHTSQDQIQYMANQNIFDDVYYLWNKDVLLQEIPDMITSSYLHDYDEGTAYNFWQYESFGTDKVLSFYFPDGEISPMIAEDSSHSTVEKNINYLSELVKAHPDTDFIFFLPAYSILWWDISYRGGITDTYFYELKYSIKELLQYDNVTFYTGLFNDKDTIYNFDYYCDYIHTSEQLNQLSLESFMQGNGKLTLENYEIEIEKMRTILNEFEQRLLEEGTDFLYE